LWLVHIYTDGDDKKVERDMYAAITYFQDFNDHDGYKERTNHLEYLFSYFSLTTEQKYRYAQMKLDGKAYWW